MTLITDSKDERLEFDTLCHTCGPRPLLDEDGACASCGADAQGQGIGLVMQSLRAMIAERDALLKEKEAAESQLCRAKEALSRYGKHREYCGYTFDQVTMTGELGPECTCGYDAAIPPRPNGRRRK